MTKPFLRRTLAPLLLLAVTFGACGVQSVHGTMPRAPRPLVLLVHGRGHAGVDTALLRHSWQRALESGARQVAGEPLLVDGDVELVWYADVLDPRSPARCERRGPGERAREEPSGLGVLAGIAGGLLSAIADGAAGDDATELRGLVGDLRFFGDAEARCAAGARLAAALDRAARTERPVVLVAHSMGALLTWSHLRAQPASAGPPRVRRLVTLGSPVGSADVRALLGFGGGALDVPPGVGSWVNVVAEGDPFAVRVGAGPGFTDVPTRAETRGDAHEILRYLQDPATAEAVFGAWCRAFAGRAPTACGRIATR